MKAGDWINSVVALATVVMPDATYLPCEGCQAASPHSDNCVDQLDILKQLQVSTRARARQKEIAASRSTVVVKAASPVPRAAILIMLLNSCSDSRP